MTTGKVLIGSLIVMGLLVALCWISIWWQKRFPGRDYDERQKQVQGNAYHFAFNVGACYYLSLFIWLSFGETPLDSPAMILVGVMIQAVAYHVYCLMKNAALPLENKGWLMVASYGLICIANILNFRSRMQYYEAYWQYVKVEPDTTLPVPENLELAWVMLMLAVASGILALVYLRSLLRQEE